MHRLSTCTEAPALKWVDSPRGVDFAPQQLAVLQRHYHITQHLKRRQERASEHLEACYGLKAYKGWVQGSGHSKEVAVQACMVHPRCWKGAQAQKQAGVVTTSMHKCCLPPSQRMLRRSNKGLTAT